MDVIKHNRNAWDKKVEDGSSYTKHVNSETIEKSKLGDWEIILTTKKTVPRKWFPASVKGLKILCLASGGGQQGPILAAAGANVTVVDVSRKQLNQDELVAKRDRLHLKTIQGDMSDLHFFTDQTFDMIVHPVSNLFVKDILPVWKEAARVLKDGGTLISGFTNPLLYIFDEEQEIQGNLQVKNKIPSTSLSGLTPEEIQAYIKSGETVEFAHTMEDQIQGQINAGLAITGFYEDDFGGERVIDKYIKTFIATKAVKIKVG